MFTVKPENISQSHLRVRFSRSLKWLKIFPVGYCLDKHPDVLFYKSWAYQMCPFFLYFTWLLGPGFQSWAQVLCQPELWQTELSAQRSKWELSFTFGRCCQKSWTLLGLLGNGVGGEVTAAMAAGKTWDSADLHLVHDQMDAFNWHVLIKSLGGGCRKQEKKG